jgi:hypothetical protein
MARISKQDREDSIALLREQFPKGSTVWTILANVSRSGMMRHIRVLALTPDGPRYWSYHVARALGWTVTAKGDSAVKVSGCGMDMGFHLAYTLAQTLYDDGRALNHRWL